MRIAFLITVVAAGPSLAASLPKDQIDFFESKIRPILAENCYECHSAEKGKSKGGLTLDTAAALRKGGQSGVAIEPGKPAESLLLKAVKHEDPDLNMPAKAPKLCDDNIAALEQWIKMGAPDPRDGKTAPARLTGLTDQARAHWAYQPVKYPPVPAVRKTEWVANEVDAFILAKLEEKNLAPNAAATRQALIRRAYYDLIGTPPSPKEVIDFVHDESPDAWAKIVDRLLASPHYGERWGRHWLDTARYSDTTGGDKKVREEYRYADAWTYRDYVVRSFNDDMPWPQFIIEQLAADRLPVDQQGKDCEALAALGFLTVGQRFQNVNDEINDRIDVVTKGFLGLTVSCARCHDHKFDPIPTADYYSLHGIFASTVELKDKPLLVDAKGESYDDFLKKKEALEKQNRDIYYRLMSGDIEQFCRNAGPLLVAMADVGGRRGRNADPKQRAEALRQAHLDPEFARRFIQNAARTGLGNSAAFWPWRSFAALPKDSFAEKAKTVLADITGPSPSRPVNPLVAKAFADAAPASLADVAAVYQKLYTGLEPQIAPLLAACGRSTDGTVTGLDGDVIALLRTPVPVETANALDTAGLRQIAARLQPKDAARAGFVFSKINELELTHPGAPPKAMAVADSQRPHNSSIFLRGQAETRGDIVPRRFLEILAGPDRPVFKDGSGRLELARAIASPQNPLTARVLVNRVWMQHFGDGLVPTPDDLGVQSEKPSHPELLDWLATKFMADGWSLKKLHREILLSNAWQQSSETRPDGEKMDPQNRLLWRANLRRLDFESVRDSLLTFSGRLDPKMFGQPVNITSEPYTYRRSVYGYIDRGNLPDLMQHFDFSDPDMPNSKRATTVVPQQALFLMNSPMAVDVARKLVVRPEFTAAHDDIGRIRALYEILFQRWPKADEIRLAKNFLLQGPAGNDKPMALANQPMTRGDFRGLGREQRMELRKQGVLPPNANPNKPGGAGKGMNDGKKPIQNADGERIGRAPLTRWEEYAQALLFTNELAYVN